MIEKETLFSNVETVNSKQIAVLKKHFPQCFDKDGRFVQDKLTEIIQGQGVDVTTESYSLDWLGKSYARLLANLPPETLLTENVAHNQEERNKNSENLFIEGDNIEVLKHMVNAYSEKVKMIYIDPPYNTGSDGFVYQDDRKFTPEQLSNLAGIDLDEAERILAFTDRGSNSHSAWLTFMYPRLYVARELLSDDGVIFISIDDNEVAQLRLICDEIFGADNFLGMIIHNKLNSKNDTSNIQKNHDYLLCFSKKNQEKPLLIKKEKIKINVIEDNGEYYILNDPITTRGEGGVLSERENLGYTVYYHSGTKDFHGVFDYKKDLALTSDIENEVYFDDKSFITKGYIKIRPPRVRGKLGVWTWSLENFNNNKNLISIVETRNGYQVRQRRPVDKEKVTKEGGKYTVEVVKESNTKSILEFSSNEGTTQLANILNQKDIFTNPKNVEYLKYLFSLVGGDDYTMLDFFAGSGASIQALLELNAQDEGKRNFIAIQWSEPTKKNSSALAAGYKTIAQISKERIHRAAKKIQEEHPEYEGDLGFKLFNTIPDFRADADTELSLSNKTFFDDAVLSEEQYLALLTTWRVYDGSLLTSPVVNVSLDGYQAHLCDSRLYFIAPNFHSEALTTLLKQLDEDEAFAPNKIVLYGSNFDSSKQLEINDALKSYANKKSIELDLIVRY